MTRPRMGLIRWIAGALLAHLVLVGFPSASVIAAPLSGGAGTVSYTHLTLPTNREV